MSESETDPGVSQAQIEAALADPSFVSLRQSGAPVLVIASDAARVVYASDEARRLFAGDLAALTRRLLHGGEPGASRIVALSHALLPGAAPRLERLRFFFGPVAETVTVLCRRVARPEGAPLFALAVLGMRAPPPTDKTAIDGHFETASDREAARDAAMVASESAPTSSSVVDAPAPATPGVDVGESGSPDAAVASPTLRATRFSWRTDGDHVVTALSPALAATVGAANAALVGRSLIDFAQDHGLDADGRLAAALAARDTFSGVLVSWPVDDGAFRAPVTLGAAPAFDAADRFEGFRGFGLVHPERNASAPITAAVAPAVNGAPEHAHDHKPVGDAAGEPAAVDSSAEISNEDHSHKAVFDMVRAYAAETDVEAPVVASAPAAPDAREPEADIAAPAPAVAQERAVAPEPEPSELDEIVALTDSGAPVYGHDVAPVAASIAPPPDTEILSIDTPEEDEPAAAPPPRTGTVVRLRPQNPQRSAAPVGQGVGVRPAAPELSPGEKSAFEEIARALAAASPTAPKGASAGADRLSPAANKRARDLIDLVARFGRSQEPAPEAAQSKSHAKSGATTLPAAEAKSPAAASDGVVRETRAVVVAPGPVAPQGSNGNLAAMVDRMPVGVVVARFNVALYANRTLLDLLDFTDVDAFHAAGGLDRLFHGRAPDSGVAQIETREGELLPVDARVQAIDWDGEPATLVTLRRAQEPVDTSRLKALELDLRQRDAEARELHAILDTATDGVAVLDADGRILSLNRSGEALFGYDQNEVAGEHISVLVAREGQDAVADYLDGLKSGGVASVLNDGREILGRARQGGTIPVFMTLGRLGGTTPKFCAVLRDLTSWKKVEHELGDARRDAERASALKSDFLAKVSHEIRTPLNAILGFAEVIMDERFGPVGNARYRDYMRDIHKSGEHVLSLVNDLLDLSKIEAGKVDLTFTSVDANAIVSECVSIMQPQAARERVVVRLSLAPNLPNIVADERSMRQIVLNILSNAVKFNEPGGQVIVSTALTDAGHAVVRVKDTGVGMTDAELELALEPFRQIATSRKNEGTGLGLPLTKALVEANRASFTIKSRKSEGTLVEVVFPPTRVLAE